MSAFRIQTGSLGKVIRFLGCITLHASRTPAIMKSISKDLSQRAFVLLLVRRRARISRARTVVFKSE